MSEGYASEAQSEIPIDPALLAEQTQAQLEQQDEGAVHDALLEPELEVGPMCKRERQADA